MAQEPIKTSSGSVRIVDSSIFPVSTTIAAALVEVNPGGLRELHWHPNTDEWQYYIEGQGRMGVFGASGQARTFDYQAGDVGYVPFAMGHYIENIGTTPLRFLEMFKSSYFADLSLDTWMALTPPELLQAHLKLDRQVMDGLRKKQGAGRAGVKATSRRAADRGRWPSDRRHRCKLRYSGARRTDRSSRTRRAQPLDGRRLTEREGVWPRRCAEAQMHGSVAASKLQ